MKKHLSISLLLFATVLTFSQIPEKMSYQAVVRDAGGVLVSNSVVGMHISVLQESATGAIVFEESHAPTSNVNGLVTILIGDGDPVSGSFSDIDWSAGPYFIKTEVDPSGGSNYTISGTTQVLSVPYALHAKTAEYVDITETDPLFSGSVAASISEYDVVQWNNKLDAEIDGDETNELQSLSKDGNKITLSHNGGMVTDSFNTYLAGEGIEIDQFTISLEKKLQVGDLHAGGIIFFLDPSGEHGLVASLDDLDGGDGVQWSDRHYSEIGPDAKSATVGVSNTEAILAHQRSTSAAQLCRNLGPEWYLPSNRELYQLFTQELIIDQILDNDGDPTTNGLVQEKTEPTLAWYWSSTEQDQFHAWVYKAASGDSSKHGKEYTFRVRAVKAF